MNNKKCISIYFIWLVICVIGIDLFLFRQENIKLTLSGGYDGIFVWGVNRMLILGIMPISIGALWNAVFDNDIRPVNVIRYSNRWKLYKKQSLKLLAISLASVVIAIVVSYGMAYFLNDARQIAPEEMIINDEKWVSYEWAANRNSVDLGLEIYEYNRILSIIQVVLINTLWVFLSALIINNMMWRFKYRIIPLFICFSAYILVGIKAKPFPWVYKLEYFGFNISIFDYYQEITSLSRAFQGYIWVFVFITIVLIIGKMIVQKKDFV